MVHGEFANDACVVIHLSDKTHEVNSHDIFCVQTTITIYAFIIILE